MVQQAHRALVQQACQALQARLEALAQLAFLVPSVPLEILGLRELREEAVLQGLLRRP